MKEYKQTEEYHELIESIGAHLDNKRQQFHIDGFGFYTFVQPSQVEYIMDAYDIPFFDKFTTFYYHKDAKLILNLNIFYHQLEFFMKSLFIRIFWFNDRDNADKFAQFIWSEYCKSNDSNFNNLKEQALKIFNDSETIADFYNNFVLNKEYTFIHYTDYQDMASKTFKALGYKFIMPSLVEFPEGSIRVFEDRQATKLDRTIKADGIDIKQLRLISVFDKLSTMAKYNFVPANKVQALKTFNFSLVINEGMFFPQLLVFPK